ncbi:MAG: monovalent cation/H+ antiporter complex subunit F [Oceanipulchritudo sp.]
MDLVINIFIALFVVAILIPFIRLIKGPTVFDRLLSIGAIGGKTIALVLLIGLQYDRLDMFIDIALAYAVLNFISGIVVAEYFRMRREDQ